MRKDSSPEDDDDGSPEQLQEQTSASQTKPKEYTLEKVVELRTKRLRTTTSFQREFMARLESIDGMAQDDSFLRSSGQRPGGLWELRMAGRRCNRDEFRNLFDLFDKDSDGQITAAELSRFMQDLHSADGGSNDTGKFTEEYCRRNLIAGYDNCSGAGADGQISKEEFCRGFAAKPKRKMITHKAMKSLRWYRRVFRVLGLVMAGGFLTLGAVLTGLLLSEDFQVDAPGAQTVLLWFFPNDACASDSTLRGYAVLLLVFFVPAGLLQSMILPAWLLSLQLGAKLAADSVHDIIRTLKPLASETEQRRTSRLSTKIIYDADEWERKVQNPTAMLVEKMRHLSGCTCEMRFFATVFCFADSHGRYMYS